METNDGRVTLLGRHADIMAKMYDRINNYHQRPLHKAQILVGRDYFTRGIRVCMSQWARNTGKTECALFLSNTASVLNDKFWTMIICPELKQAKKIYWHKKRLQDYAPPEFIKDVGSTDLKVEFHNGSLITLDGQENYEALRGVKPDLVIYDEFQHHSKEFHLEVMEPNLISKSTALYIFGTPPKSRSAYYVDFREELLKSIKDGDVESSYYEFAADVNPKNDPVQLAKRRKKLFESGDEVIWYREYEGKLVFGTSDAVFPKWNPPVHVYTHRVATSYLENDRHKLKWYTICDPGSSSCFAVLFACYNPYTQQIFLLDEIYEKDRRRTDSRSIWDQIRKKEEALYPGAPERGTWIRVYDEQATWFGNEIMANFKLGLIPSKKQKTTEENDISRIKVLMAEHRSLVVSDRCYWLRWEIEAYVTDDNGEYVDENNHLIDCFKYLMQHTNWKLIEKAGDAIPMPDGSTRSAENVDPNDWADNIVEGSLAGGSDDPYSDYY